MRRAFGLSSLFALVVLFMSDDAGAVTLKNFRELGAHYSAATGIGLDNAVVKPVYAAVKSRLPKTGQVGEFSSPAVLGALELGGAFCGEFIKAEQAITTPANRRAHQKIADFNGRLSAATDADLLFTARNYARLFWMRDFKSTEEAVFQASLTAMRKDANATTKQALQTMCMQAATSLDALVNK